MLAHDQAWVRTVELVQRSGIVMTVSEDLAISLGRVESPTLEFKREAKDRDAIRKAVRPRIPDQACLGAG